jgi:hypothetical protein
MTIMLSATGRPLLALVKHSQKLGRRPVRDPTLKPIMSDGDDTDAAPIAIDKVGASKAGHACQEAWAARTALELLPPSTDLTSFTFEAMPVCGCVGEALVCE